MKKRTAIIRGPFFADQSDSSFIAVCKQAKNFNVKPAYGDKHRESIEVFKIFRQPHFHALLDLVKIQNKIHGGYGANYKRYAY